MDSGQSKRNHPKKPVNLTDDDVKKYLKDLKQKENILKKFDKLLKDISDFDVMTFRLEEEDVYTKYDHFSKLTNFLSSLLKAGNGYFAAIFGMVCVIAPAGVIIFLDSYHENS